MGNYELLQIRIKSFIDKYTGYELSYRTIEEINTRSIVISIENVERIIYTISKKTDNIAVYIKTELYRDIEVLYLIEDILREIDGTDITIYSDETDGNSLVLHRYKGIDKYMSYKDIYWVGILYDDPIGYYYFSDVPKERTSTIKWCRDLIEKKLPRQKYIW